MLISTYAMEVASLDRESIKVRVGRIRFRMKIRVGYVRVGGVGGKVKVEGKEG